MKTNNYSGSIAAILCIPHYLCHILTLQLKSSNPLKNPADVSQFFLGYDHELCLLSHGSSNHKHHSNLQNTYKNSRDICSASTISLTFTWLIGLSEKIFSKTFRTTIFLRRKIIKSRLRHKPQSFL